MNNFKDFTDCQLAGALKFIEKFDKNNQFFEQNKAIENIFIKQGTGYYDFLIKLLKKGYILENVTERNVVNIKMIDNKICGYYEGEGWVEMNDAIIKSGKWKPIL